MNAPLTIHLDSDAAAGAKTLGAVDKALVILTTVMTSAEPLPLAEVSRRCGLPKPTVHRLLAILCAHNMVTRSGVTYSVQDSAPAARRQGDDVFLALLKNEATPYLVELHNATGATAAVSALVDGSPRHLGQVYGHRGIRVTTAMPAVDVASDMILRAYDTGSNAHAVRDLFEIRRAGIAYGNTSQRGVASMAVPVCGTGTMAPAALSVISRPGGLDPVGASRELRRCAYELTRTLRRMMSATVTASWAAS